MRISLVILALGAVVASPAMAAPEVSAVRVSIGPDLAKKTQVMDRREFDYLTRELKRSVEKTLDRSGALADGGELDLVIEDARPNRPTMREMSAKPGLSYQSFGVGGARVSGEYRAASGARTPVDYSWYETDIRWAEYGSTWSDADKAFDRLAVRLAKDFGDR
ncbi:hypothetical protein [Caulobacter sp. DWR1-3-2b1]|uniref:hypothetical protein n=1 Tax=Caulobacter sp. DWR1-3-2b1 TaxID=2804670 RepID=UPI003CF6C0DC